MAAVACPPYLYEWREDRAEVAESLGLLREALAQIPSAHPARADLVAAARRIDEWLTRWPDEPEQRPYEAGVNEWNREIAWELIDAWKRVGPLLDLPCRRYRQ